MKNSNTFLKKYRDQNIGISKDEISTEMLPTELERFHRN